MVLQAGIESDTAIQNSVMRVAKQQGQSPAQLEAYLEQLRKLGLQPDEQTFNVLLRAYVAYGNLEGASDILERMVEDGESPCLIYMCLTHVQLIVTFVGLSCMCC